MRREINCFKHFSQLNYIRYLFCSNYANSDLTTVTIKSGSSNSSIGSSGMAGMYSIAQTENMKPIREDVTDESGVVLISSTPLHTPRGSTTNLS